MSYPQCMTHDLAAAHPHDFAWSAQCAKKHLYIGACCCPQEAVLCPLRHGWSDQLYGMEGAWKNSPTCCALLNVGLTAILKRTHIYVLIWACNPASPNSTTVIFHNCSSFKTKPTKNKDVVLFCCHEHVHETISVVLHGRSHPAQGSRVRGSQGLYGFKGTKI